VALSRVMTIHCGDQKLAWNWFRAGAVELIQSPRIHEYLAIEAIRAIENIVTLDDSRMEKETGGKLNDDKTHWNCEVLLLLLWTFHTAECGDERDRLFSLYGMLPDTRLGQHQSSGLDLPNIIDYGTHFVHTYTTLWKDLMGAGSCQDLLDHVIAFGSLA
jgi:hypothetical protein